MRVLINAVSAKRGGILTYTANLARSLAERGITLMVAVPPGFSAPPGVQFLPMEASNYSSIRRLVWEQTMWRSIVSRKKPDLLFSSANFGLLRSPVRQLLLMREGGLFDPQYLANIAPAQGPKAAVIRHLRRRMMLTSIRHADRVMTPSHTLRNLLLKWVPDQAGKIFVNTYGTLDETFQPPAQRRAWRADGVLRLLFVSVYYPHKNPGDLCRAVERLNALGIPTHATITMRMEEIENTPGGAHDAYFVRRAVEAGLVTLGQVPYAELPQTYNDHDMFVFPAIGETFGHPMAEAMSSSLPVLVADTNIAREVCGDGALYFRPFDVGHLCEQILRFDGEPALREQLAARGRTQVREHLRWKSHVDRLVETFEQMLR